MRLVPITLAGIETSLVYADCALTPHVLDAALLHRYFFPDCVGCPAQQERAASNVTSYA